MLGIAALIGVIVLLWLRAKKTRPSYYFAAVQVLLCGVILAGFTVAFLRSGTLASHFPICRMPTTPTALPTASPPVR